MLSFAVTREQDSTVPYAEAVWGDAGDLRILVVDAEEQSRHEAALVIERMGYKVASAADRSSAAKLFLRFEPDVVVADLETIAPDFEPLRAALEAFFGEHSATAVVLLGSNEPREETEWVKAYVPKPLEFSNVERLVAAVEALAQAARRSSP